MSRAVLVDRDGVLNALVPRAGGGPPEGPLHPDQVHLVRGAAAALRRLRAAGYRIAVVTNQPGAAKGECTPADLDAVQTRVADLLARDGAAPDAVLVCRHHPGGIEGHPLTMVCGCRKPAPGMLLDALARFGAEAAASWMVGDADTDLAAGRAAGVRTILVHSPGGEHKRQGDGGADAEVADLAAAAALILGSADQRSA